MTKGQPGQTVFDLRETENGDWFAHYLLLKKHAHQTKNEIRIGILKQMLEAEETAYLRGDLTFRAQIVSLTNIALEYILMNNFTEGNNYLAESMKRCEVNKFEIPIGNIQNYIANQINLKRYEQGVQFFKKFENRIRKGRSSVEILALCSFCHVFLNQPDEALTLVYPSRKLAANNLVVSRLICAIAYYLRGHADLAFNECVNLKRASATRAVGGNSNIYTKIVPWLTVFFAAHLKGKADKEAGLEALKQTLIENTELITPHLKKEYALLWLVEMMKGKTK